MVSELMIEVRGFSGMDVDVIIKEMVSTAARLDLWVTSNVNGIHVLAAPDDSQESLWANYQKARDRGASFVSGNVIPKGKGATDV